jgi:hypothetical protein
MLDRLKRTLVDSYIGAIALGWLLAQDIMYFVGIFSTPVASWVSQNTYREMTQKATGLAGFPFQAALPELVRAFLLLMVWSVLIRCGTRLPRSKKSCAVWTTWFARARFFTSASRTLPPGGSPRQILWRSFEAGHSLSGCSSSTA